MNLPPRIALIGFMGSGKSTTGKLLAERLGYRFIDLDDRVEERAGMKIADIFAQSGEAYFRSLETKCLADLASSSGIVLAAGGGAPLQEANRAFFGGKTSTFYLHVSLATALERAVSAAGARPLLMQDPAAVRALYESRLPVYGLLGRTVEADARSPDGVVDEIFSLLGVTIRERGRGRSG
jgi:shikimate kinase